MLAATVLNAPYKATTAIVKHRFVKLSGDESVAAITGVTDKALGVSHSDVSAAEFPLAKAQAIAMLGIAYVEAAAAITAMDFVAPSANGRAQTAVATQFAAGVALRAAGAAGDLIPVFLSPFVFTLAKA